MNKIFAKPLSAKYFFLRFRSTGLANELFDCLVLRIIENTSHGLSRYIIAHSFTKSSRKKLRLLSNCCITAFLLVQYFPQINCNSVFGKTCCSCAQSFLNSRKTFIFSQEQNTLDEMKIYIKENFELRDVYIMRLSLYMDNAL